MSSGPKKAATAAAPVSIEKAQKVDRFGMFSKWAKETSDKASAMIKEKSANLGRFVDEQSAAIKEKSKAAMERIKEPKKNGEAPYRSSDVPVMFSIDDDDEPSPSFAAAIAPIIVHRAGLEADLGPAILRHTTTGQITIDLSLIADQVFKLCNPFCPDLNFMYTFMHHFPSSPFPISPCPIFIIISFSLIIFSLTAFYQTCVHMQRDL